jgi:phenylalanyl-tRNA synthetase beta chain
MLFTLNWLDEFVDCRDLSPDDIARRLTMAGLEVEGVSYLGECLKKVMVGRLVSLKDHPQEPKWKVCKVAIGGEEVQVVSGAPCLEEGKRVLAALPGASLPSGMVVEAVELKGVASQGNLVSEIELDLAEEGEVETVIFPEKGEPGELAAPLVFMDDHLLETSPTPNRPDCLGILGVARELAVLLGRPLKVPPIAFPQEGPSIEEVAWGEIKDPDLCPRYCARYIEGIQAGPSPLSMKVRLKAAGIRSISNVVDATNYVLVEMGHPLHAFDYDDLRGHKIVVRRAKKGEVLVTLDGEARDLTPEVLLIADAERGVALAGIMGGANSEVRERSQRILIESAFFEPTSIRKTSKGLGISTEASKRFERGADIEGLVRALDRVTQLIMELAGGKAAQGMLDVYPEPYVPKKVSLSHGNLEGVLGATVAPDKVGGILEGLGFAPQWDGEKWGTTVPSFRAFDVSREIDLVEEVARVYGYHNIPSTMPSGPLPREKVESQRTLIVETEAILSGMGLMEVINYSFIDPRSLSALKLAASDPRLRFMAIKNPLSEEMSVMRTILLPGLLDTALVNERAQVRDMALFEVGRVFLPGVPERLHVGILAMGKREVSWDQKGQDYDFFFVKGVVEKLARRLKGVELQLKKGKEPFLHSGRSASLNVGGKSVGYIGEIHPQLARSYRLSHRCYVAELLLEVLGGEKRMDFEPLPRFPGSIRDLSLIAPMDLSHSRILAMIRELSPPRLREVSLIDHYTGPPVEAGKRSLTYSLLYRAEDRTLTDQEVEGEHGDLVKKLESKLPITIRR